MASEQAPNRLFVKVREFALQTPDWAEATRYFTLPDERFDLTLVSARVYGTRDLSMVIQAAAGLDTPEYELTERMLVLPTREQLRAMRIDAGYDANEI